MVLILRVEKISDFPGGSVVKAAHTGRSHRCIKSTALWPLSSFRSELRPKLFNLVVQDRGPLGSDSFGIGLQGYLYKLAFIVRPVQIRHPPFEMKPTSSSDDMLHV